MIVQVLRMRGVVCGFQLARRSTCVVDAMDVYVRIREASRNRSRVENGTNCFSMVVLLRVDAQACVQGSLELSLAAPKQLESSSSTQFNLKPRYSTPVCEDFWLLYL